MTKDQALNYLKSSGFSKEQIQAIVKALSSSDDLSSELAKNSKKLEKETTKNDLGVDAVSRQAVNGYIDYILSHGMGKKKSFDFIKKFVANLPPSNTTRAKIRMGTRPRYIKSIL